MIVINLFMFVVGNLPIVVDEIEGVPLAPWQYGMSTTIIFLFEKIIDVLVE